MNIELTDQVDCLGDFTFDFYWQHKGSRLSPDAVIPHQKDTSHTYSDLVECLKRGEDVHIKGDAGKRLGSSLGVDLRFFGGSGGSLKVGSIMVDGNVDNRMGMSTGILMNRGSVHVYGDAGMNTGVLMRGGIVLVNNTGEFAGSYTKGGAIFYKGDAMQRSVSLEESDIRMLIRLLGTGKIEAMMFRKYSR